MAILRSRKIPSSTKFGANLKYMRNIKGLSQSKLAEAVGLKRNNIASYEAGKVEPKATNFLKIANFFDIDPFTMLEFDFINENILTSSVSMEDTIRPELIESDLIEELTIKTHEMGKIVEGYQTFKEIHEPFFDHSMDISHMMLDTIKLFEKLLDTNWKLIHNVANNNTDLNNSEDE